MTGTRGDSCLDAGTLVVPEVEDWWCNAPNKALQAASSTCDNVPFVAIRLRSDTTSPGRRLISLSTKVGPPILGLFREYHRQEEWAGASIFRAPMARLQWSYKIYSSLGRCLDSGRNNSFKN